MKLNWQWDFFYICQFGVMEVGDRPGPVFKYIFGEKIGGFAKKYFYFAEVGS
jgi:hypothetical protein